MIESKEMQPQADLVVQKLTECQSRLFAFIYSLTADSELAWDVLQDTNRLLWKKAGEFDGSRDFLPWALTHAFNQVRTVRRKHQRERLVFHDEATLDLISEQWSSRERGCPAGSRTVALEHCLGELPAKQRDLIDRYYSDDESLPQIARARNCRENTLAVQLHRIRKNLAKCIRMRLNHQ